MADSLITTMRTAGAKLALPQGTITREAIRGDTVERTTIDLVWLLVTLAPRLIQCRVAREIEQALDHLPIVTWIQTEAVLEAQVTRKRRAWKMIDDKIFNKVFRETSAGLDNYPLTSETDIEATVKDLTRAINRAVDASTPWARPSAQAKPWWTLEC